MLDTRLVVDSVDLLQYLNPLVIHPPSNEQEKLTYNLKTIGPFTESVLPMQRITNNFSKEFALIFML